MKVLFILTYYRPHVSGLTIYVERLARELAARGHEVTVLTSHYAAHLPREERMDVSASYACSALPVQQGVHACHSACVA